MQLSLSRAIKVVAFTEEMFHNCIAIWPQLEPKLTIIPPAASIDCNNNNNDTNNISSTNNCNNSNNNDNDNDNDNNNNNNYTPFSIYTHLNIDERKKIFLLPSSIR